MNFFSPSRLRELLTGHHWIGYVGLALLSFLVLTYIQLDPTFADPDSFYHAKMAILMRDQGVVTSFPWLSQTVLADRFVDHQLLYHLLLIPFVSALPPLVGMKIATALFGAGAMVAFYWVLQRLNVRYAWVYVVWLLGTTPFLFRLGLAKTQPLVLLALCLGLGFVVMRKPVALAVTSFFYVWLYAGWPMLAVITGAYVVTTQLLTGERRGLWGLRKLRWRVARQNWWMVLSLGIGVSAGICINPYFPTNIWFAWLQVVEIGLVNHQAAFSVGSEWYPYGIQALLIDAPLVWLGLISALGLAVWQRKKMPVLGWTAMLVAAACIVLTLKSRRYVEYAVPMSLLAVAIVYTSVWPVLFKRFFKKLSTETRGAIALGIFLALVPGALVAVYHVRNAYAAGFGFDEFGPVSRWLSTHSARGQVVFHSDWDQFPLLFFHNVHNYYLVGLDPTFFYLKNSVLHAEWIGITTGDITDRLAQRVKKDFGAQYVLIDRVKNSAFATAAARDRNLLRVYEDEHVVLYRVDTL